ncbi:hypothetical protein [Brevibacillus sp. 179-C9.3 HS]|uniref:hypothetical protein n=1 Tax=unclassified Brevibacillus TaxID=2684853 RepID=UPI0039A1D3E4
MSKKWIAIFIGVYILGGIAYVGTKNVNDSGAHLNPETSLSEQETRAGAPSSYHMAWFVQQPGKGNFEPPYWLSKPELEEHVEEMSHDHEHAKTTSPDSQLMTFFSYLQLGPPKDLNSFINPDISYQDISAKDFQHIEETLKELGNEISRGKTIKEVYLSDPQLSDDQASFDVTIVYQDEKIVKLPKLAMVSQNEVKNWFIDIRLSELASQVKRLIQT